MRQRRGGKTSETEGDSTVRSGAPSAVADLPPDSTPNEAAAIGSVLGLRNSTSERSTPPINEWGFYDPDLAGAGALVSSIDTAEIPISGNVEEDPGELLLRQVSMPEAARTGVFRPLSPFDLDAGRQPSAAAAVASCRVSHLAPLSLWARVTDSDEPPPRPETADQIGRLLSQWLLAERSRKRRRLASSDLAAQIGELTHPAHVALTGLSPVCRIRGIRTAPLAVVPQPTDEIPEWAEPAFTPVPDTIALEYLQGSAAERAASSAHRKQAAQEGAATAVESAAAAAEPAEDQDMAPGDAPEAAALSALELEPVPEPALESEPETLSDTEPASTLEAAPEPEDLSPLETLPDPALEPEADLASDAALEIDVASELVPAPPYVDPAPPHETRDVEAVADFEPVAVAPPAFDAIPIDFMMAPAPAEDLAGFEAVSFDRGMAQPIDLEPARRSVDLAAQIMALPVEAERPVTARSLETEPEFVALPAEPGPVSAALPVETAPETDVLRVEAVSETNVLLVEAAPETDPRPVEVAPAVIVVEGASGPVIDAQPVEAQAAPVDPPVNPEPVITAPTAAVEPEQPLAAAQTADEPILPAAEPSPGHVDVRVPLQSLQPTVKKRRRTALALG